MGLRGPGAERRRAAAVGRLRTTLPWQKRGLSRIERIIRFLEFLPVTKGKLAGKRMKLLPDQLAFIHDVYGPRKERVRLAIKSEPRGNGKTGLMTGLELCHLLGPEAEFRGECLSAGIDREQAGIVFNEMEAIILAVPEFADRVNILRWHKRIEVLGGDGIGSRFEALSADGRRAHGLAPSFWVYDELAQAKNRVLLDNLQTAMGKRTRTLGIIISTQAADDDHPLSQLIDDGLRGVDPSIVVHLLAAPQDADPFDPKTIRAVNPAFGKFLDESDVLKEAERARRMPSFESAFRNLRLNQRIAADARALFMTPEVWARSSGAIDEDLFFSGRPVYGGLDLSARTDLTALVLACADDEGWVHLKPIAWTPGETVHERTLRDRAPYDAWVRQGFIHITPGPAIDLDFVAARIAELTQGMNLATIHFDDWAMDYLKQAFVRIGYMPPLSSFRQGFRTFAPAVTLFEVMALEGKLRHGGHPVLRWCIGNTSLARDPAGNRKPDKSKYYGRIDLAVAAIMAVAAMNQSAPEIEIAALIA
jgi:phage terminase large subunit-like protein